MFELLGVMVIGVGVMVGGGLGSLGVVMLLGSVIGGMLGVMFGVVVVGIGGVVGVLVS